MRWNLLIVLPVALLGCAPRGKPITVMGRVLGQDGAPLRSALVLVNGPEVRERFAVDSGGNVALRLPGPGGYFMWILGVHHQAMLQPLLVEDSKPIRFAVRLAAAERRPVLDSLQAIGSFNGFSKSEGGRWFRPQPDGTFTVTVPAGADTVAYQMLGLQPGEYAIEGTSADRQICPRGHMLVGGKAGSFVSVLSARGDSVRIQFDPRELPAPGGAAGCGFAPVDSRPARLAAIYQEFEQRRERFVDSLDAHCAAGRPPEDFRFDWSPDRAAVRAALAREHDPVLRQYRMLRYFELFDPAPEDSLLARRLLAELPPTSPVWSLEWGSAGFIATKIERAAKQPEQARAYNRRVVDRHPDSEVRAEFLYIEVMKAFTAMQAERKTLSETDAPAAVDAELQFSELYGRLITDFPTSQQAKRAAARCGPGRRIQAGKAIPDFTMPALEDTTVTYSLGQFRGRVFLLDFWALSCGPCIGELPTLHATYEKYKGRGFQILSIAFDAPPKVAAFRRDRWPMPWLHGWARRGFRDELATRFEVVAIPRTILVDEHGTILAVDLRQQRLEETLQQIFPAGKE